MFKNLYILVLWWMMITCYVIIYVICRWLLKNTENDTLIGEAKDICFVEIKPLERQKQGGPFIVNLVQTRNAIRLYI